MLRSIPKRIRIQHPGRMRETEKASSSKILWPYRSVMVLGALCFLIAISIGIWRIAVTRGFNLPPIPESWPAHGEIMLGGFLASLIIFERMIALPIDSLIWVPYVYATSALMLHSGHPFARGIHLAALAGWLLHRWIAYRKFHRWEKPLVESVAFITLTSALMYPGGLPSRPEVALQGLVFPIAVIAVERLEMSFLLKKIGSRMVLLLLIGWCSLWNLSTWRGIPNHSVMGGITLLLVALIAFYDTALRVSQKQSDGLHKFLRTALMLSYAWLFLGAVAMTASSKISSAIFKDVQFHLIGLGFIFTMILGHAPLILSSALSKLPPKKAPMIPFLVFQAATVLRILGDFALLKSVPFWQWSGWISGLIHAISFFVYVATLAFFIRIRNKKEVIYANSNRS
ncbi:hypothetical protein L0152_31720 [bacterium]|nr:hypothetical protein [bacterium]